MRAALTPEQMDGWLAYYELEPFGEERADLRVALAATGICRTWGADVSPDDFMPFRERPDEEDEQDPELAALGQIEAVRGIVARHNASV